MSLSRLPLIFAGLSLPALLCFPVHGFQGPDADPGWRIERFNWNGPPAGGRLEVLNPYGDVRIRPSGDDQVFVSGVIQRDEKDRLTQDIRTVAALEGDERLVVEAGWKEVGGEAGPETARMKKRRIDLTLLIPAAIRVRIVTRAGLIEAKGLDNPIDAETVSGEVRLSTSRSVRARAERGEMNVTFTGGGWTEASVLESRTGRVTAWLSPDADMTVRGETTGLITSDFSIDVERASAPTFIKKFTAEIGEGGDELSLLNVKGDLRILGLPR